MPSTTKPPEAGRDLLIAGGTILGAAVLIYAFYPAPLTPREGVALAGAPPTFSPPPSVAAAQAPAAPSTEGLRLSGLLGGGAIVILADGNQRWVAMGRDVLPGLKVQRIEQHHVVLASAEGEFRLGFEGVGAPAPATTTASDAPAASREAAREEALRYRLGLAPRRGGEGYVVRRGVPLPALERAGVRPGDVILGVNGSRLNEEQMLELPWTIANSTRTELELDRGGRRMRVALEEAGR